MGGEEVENRSGVAEISGTLRYVVCTFSIKIL
jgi:hypothetical protein